jgi:hypothetical protein
MLHTTPFRKINPYQKFSESRNDIVAEEKQRAFRCRNEEN